MKICVECFRKLEPINGVLYYCKNKDCSRYKLASVEEDDEKKT